MAHTELYSEDIELILQKEKKTSNFYAVVQT